MRQIVDRLQESAFKVSEQGQRLIRAEIALAQAEVKAKAQQAAPGVGLLVFAGIFLGQPMDLAFTSFEVVAIVLATVITRELIQDGRANWFEGCLLLGVYVILAIGFFHLPD